jgi:MarR family 2-MHQ and catechol resistance regulon transcriptional repressor
MVRPAQTDIHADVALRQDAEDLHEALSGLVRLYQFRDRDQICCFDVSVAQCYGLEALVREGPLTLGGLAERLYLEKSTASRVVDALERKGYVTRAAHPGDRRALQLRVTPTGRRLVERIRVSLVEDARAVLEGLSPSLRREAASFLDRLTEVAAKRLGRGPAGQPEELRRACGDVLRHGGVRVTRTRKKGKTP